MKMISGKSISKEEALIKFQKILFINNSYAEIGVYSLINKETNKFIGLGKIVWVGKSEAEIGYSLLPEN